MVRTLLLAATLGALAVPAFAQTVAPTSSGAGANPSNGASPTGVPQGTNQTPGNPNMSQPNATKPNKPATSPGASGQAPGRQFQDLDTDRNGSVSEEEYGNILGGPTQAYGSVDANRDGRISRDEYAKWLKTQPERTPRTGATPGTPPGTTTTTGAADSTRR